MKRSLLLITVAALLGGCDSPQNQSESKDQKAATQDLLKGKAEKSPVLDFSKYDGPPPNSADQKPKSESPKVTKPEKDSPGFKKSPVLDFSKY